MIKTVFKLKSGMVMVFDEYGEQLPVYQGCYENVKNQIFTDAPADAVFSHWFGCALKPELVEKECW